MYFYYWLSKSLIYVVQNEVKNKTLFESFFYDGTFQEGKQIFKVDCKRRHIYQLNVLRSLP